MIIKKIHHDQRILVYKFISETHTPILSVISMSFYTIIEIVHEELREVVEIMGELSDAC